MARVGLILLLLASLAANVWFLVRGRSGAEPARAPESGESSAPETGAPEAGAPGAAAARDPHDLLDSVERDWLRRVGLKDPAADLRSDLVGHPELIAGEGVVGGTMAFRRDQIWVLPGGHVWALADDGHIEIMMLMTYTVSREGAITWRPVYHFAP